MSALLPFILAACAVITASFSVLSYLRGGRLPPVQAFARMLREAEPFRALQHRVANTESRLQACELKLPDMATKADVAALRGELAVAVSIGARTEGSVQRIEDLLLEGKR